MGNNSSERVFSAVNLVNKSGQTCLHWAVDKAQSAVIAVLLGLAADGRLDVTVRDREGMTAYDLCRDELTKQTLWDATKVQMERKAQEMETEQKEVQQFSVQTKGSVKGKSAKGNLKRPLG